MHVVIVHIHVKSEFIQAFKEATIINATNSIQEAGILRFDFLQEADNPERFVLYEVYREKEDQLRHRETGHYLAWKDRVADMLAEPRQGVQYTNVYPMDRDWKK